jgi:GABA(A) receptor-associated protein
MSLFKQKYEFEQRFTESSRILKKYPNRIPIIAEKHPNCSLPTLDKFKYLVPAELTIGQFMYILRKRIVIQPEEAMYFCIGNHIPLTSRLIQEVYNEYKDRDLFLYILYTKESTFG